MEGCSRCTYFFFFLFMPTCLRDKLPERRLHIRVSDLLLYLLVPSGSEMYVLILLYTSVAD